MARTTQEIYEMMVRDKEQRPELAALSSNSATAVWRLLLWVVASAIQVTEVLWDNFKGDVEEQLSLMTPHRRSWYAEKAKQYMAGMVLPEGSDEYDTAGMSDSEISEKRVVKYAAAIENSDFSILYIKVAGENGEGDREPLSAEVASSVAAYMNEVKDAGVRISLVNQPAERYSCEVRVLYNPILTRETVSSGVDAAISRYVNNLPFNGEYSNMALIDAVQQVEGVKIAELQRASVERADGTVVGINVRYVPVSGYMTAADVVVTMEPYSDYEGAGY